MAGHEIKIVGCEMKLAGREMSKADFEKLARFRYRLRCYLRFSEDVARRNGITSLQYLLLLQLKGYPDREWATVGELAERLQAKHHGMVSLISRSEAAGLVKRTVGRSDRRRVEVRLTAKGEEGLRQLAHLHRAELESLQGEFSVPDWTSLRVEKTRRNRLAAFS